MPFINPLRLPNGVSRRTVVIALLLVAAAFVAPAYASPTVNPNCEFADAGYFATEACNQGLFEGKGVNAKGENIFDPSAPLTRGQAARVASNILLNASNEGLYIAPPYIENKTTDITKQGQRVIMACDAGYHLSGWSQKVVNGGEVSIDNGWADNEEFFRIAWTTQVFDDGNASGAVFGRVDTQIVCSPTL